jgi:hypothetical protein
VQHILSFAREVQAQLLNPLMKNYREKEETREENKKVQEESTVDNMHIEAQGERESVLEDSNEIQ